MARQLNTILSTIMEKNSHWQFELLRNWNTIIGNLKTNIKLEKIYNDTLVLGVYDACWLQELYLLSPLLLTIINKSLDQPRIKYLRFKRAVAQKNHCKQNREKQNNNVSTLYTLTTREKTALAMIQDPHLRTALHQFLIRCHKEKG